MNPRSVSSFDGTRLAVHRMGEGRPVLLLHGLFSDARMNWVKFGHAQKLVDAGFEAIMPDLRAHGESAKPHDHAAYPDDVLARDAVAVVEALGLEDFDLVGFSLGARTAARCLVHGMTPRKVVLSGMGLEGLSGWNDRAAFFTVAIDRFVVVTRGAPAFYGVSFMKSQKIDRVAARLLLGTMEDTSAGQLAQIDTPTMVLCGDEDRDNGSPENLAATLPNAHHVAIPGTHMGSVTQGALGDALVEFLR